MLLIPQDLPIPPDLPIRPGHPIRYHKGAATMGKVMVLEMAPPTVVTITIDNGQRA